MHQQARHQPPQRQRTHQQHQRGDGDGADEPVGHVAPDDLLAGREDQRADALAGARVAGDRERRLDAQVRRRIAIVGRAFLAGREARHGGQLHLGDVGILHDAVHDGGDGGVLEIPDRVAQHGRERGGQRVHLVDDAGPLALILHHHHGRQAHHAERQVDREEPAQELAGQRRVVAMLHRGWRGGLGGAKGDNGRPGRPFGRRTDYSQSHST